MPQLYAKLQKQVVKLSMKEIWQKRLDRFMQEHEGYLSKEDLAKYEGEWVEPISTNYKERYDVWEILARMGKDSSR